MRRKKYPILGNVSIEDIGAEGKAIAKFDNMVVFVPMAIPGDVADIRIVKKRKNYLEGTVVHYHKFSSMRVAPVCDHFGICGGCKWQHLQYSRQLIYKEKQVSDALMRIGKVKEFNILPIIPSEKTEFYRNKLEYTFSSCKWFTKEEIESGKPFDNTNAAGFHMPGMHDKVVDINKCWLQDNAGNDIRNFTREYALKNGLSFYDNRNHTGFLRNLIVRNTSAGELMIIFSFGEKNTEHADKLLHEVKTGFPEITSLLFAVNKKRNDTLYDQEIMLYAGKDHITEYLDGLCFRIGPKSFFQTNTSQALKLYNTVKEFAGLTMEQKVYDLYTGTGTIANFIARGAIKVTGIETVPEAVEDAKLNSSINGISNTLFYAGDIRTILNEGFMNEHGKPDVIITDPPRAGMHADVVQSILHADPEKIVYVSCNPSTQARDVELLGKNYYVNKVQPVDMFPHTHHVESVVLMERRS